jgi:hypothetical protein
LSGEWTPTNFQPSFEIIDGDAMKYFPTANRVHTLWIVLEDE